MEILYNLKTSKAVPKCQEEMTLIYQERESSDMGKWCKSPHFSLGEVLLLSSVSLG